MLVTCWSAKGGSGCSVVAATLALAWSRAGDEVLLVDAHGDLPGVLGLAQPEGEGLREWAVAGDAVPADGLARLETDAGNRLSLVPSGNGALDDVGRVSLLARLLAAGGRTVVVDAGLVPATPALSPLVTEARHALLVTRACYLALRRLATQTLRPSGVVLVAEPGRALDATDVEAVAEAPVVASVGVDPAVARAVDAGLLSSRLPRLLERAVRPVRG